MSKILVGLTDHYAPDVQAMMMAKYSRSYASIEDRLPDTKESEDQHRKNLAKYYIGYGHKSVSQLGGTTIWLEGVSILAAKAIENHPLYNGQESSTRYIDFSNQPMIYSDPDIQYWQERFRAFYIKAVPLVVDKLKLEFPLIENVKYVGNPETIKDSTVWENTIKARAFDICRGILPAGCTTNVAFTGTFDTINDHFGEMLFHPCEEMKQIAQTVLTKMKEVYPFATMDIDKLKERNSFVDDSFFYQEAQRDFMCAYIETDIGLIDSSDFYKFQELKIKREKFSKISRSVAGYFKVRMCGEIDFGSYRDLHRHRNGYINMEVLSPENGFHNYYLDNLPIDLSNALKELLSEYEDWYSNRFNEKYMYAIQYCTPMGYKVNVDYRCDINQAMYILELRSGKTVHQTLRSLIHWWVKFLKSDYPNLQIHADMDEDNFTLKRGQQTFVKELLT